MPLFLFKDIEEKSCDAAKEQFGISEDAVVLDEDSLPSLGSAKSPFVVLGHTQEVIYDYALWQSKKQTLGSLTADEMAEHFADMIPKEKRGELKDLYLIACEAGLNDSAEKPCYARELAYRLYRQGFTAVAVHTVTSPVLKGTPYVGMRVELVTQIGIEGKLEGIQLGHARAFLTTQDYEDLSEKISAMEIEMREIKAHTPEAVKRRSDLNRQILSGNGQLHTKSREHLIMDVADLKKELDRPENTFRAQDSLKAIEAKPKQLSMERRGVEQQKIHRQLKPVVSQKMQDDVYGPLIEHARSDKRLLAVLSELSELQRRYRNDTKYLKNIDVLVARMKEKQHNWQQAIFEKMDAYHELSVLEQLKTRRSTSSFYDLMLHLVREYRLKRMDIDASLEERIKKAVPEQAIEQVIFNKNKEKLAVTLVSRVGEKVSLIEFSLKKHEQGKLSPALIRRKIEKGHKREEENKKTYAAQATCSSDWEEEPLIPKPAHPLPAVSHYYLYTNRHHFWPATIDKGRFATLRGDQLKQAILADFKQQIEACNSDNGLKQCSGRLRQSAEFQVLSMAQDRFTHFFRWLPWVKTSSEKAFEQMLSDQASYLSLSRKNQ
ncbi:hypothetical protein DIZ81_06840 [Legionella taurinensis]|uniref:DrrA phosphatidylinositol 4-phosphate binding domain-containing protein n=1 Tax=Legionella taurinensis TaxID=70611 RepID=A0AB38N5P1_9GAMM|nr:hypothetical protein [Legionella taurinensis]MDX1837212.1 hypothetical protein [Legionella taurinensis]PUT40314.1 hypothetical protein DB744_06840 [Legionella taurinensis]PUT41548.1 hypothetical protein DB746_09350 [Legionella taurinensis]PUT44414.1 hypothetical protein DB743_08565 [Legionella taurinensis]PUT48376.1 hypothetical protein DB745_05240 [Legionella taurinensis]